MSLRTYKLIGISLAFTFLGFSVSAASPEPPRDGIELVASVATRDRPVQKILLTEHGGRDLAYLQEADDHSVMIIDVTHAAHPEIVRDMSLPEGLADLKALAGDVALVADRAAQAGVADASFSVVYLGDPRREHSPGPAFQHVTAVAEDDRRGLIYLADRSGLQILQKVLAPDQETAREFEKRLMYDR